MASAQTRRSGALKDYLTLVAGLPRVGRAGREALAARYAAGDAGAGVAIFESFLPLVVGEAALHRGLGLRFEALIAAGNRGLAACLRAAAVPDEERVRRAVRRELRQALARAAARPSA
jgi:DNA-directed RNA polymerase sigma subunit (sigma70/sigma32)